MTSREFGHFLTPSPDIAFSKKVLATSNSLEMTFSPSTKVNIELETLLLGTKVLIDFQNFMSLTNSLKSRLV